MSATIFEAGPQLDESAIRALEDELGLVLPPAYRTFLLQNNGGYADPNVFEREDNRRTGRQRALVQDFFTIDEVRKYRGWHRGRVPENLLAVGRDPGGNMLLVSVGGPDVGRVYFWDHDRETTPPTYANVYSVADDFSRFLASLHDPDAP
ncbi:MAG: SMI1/KNR4 family protein [Deltaproteobacteria bacterium]|nr:SMI1/KNR4 family protein [Deltaproteobacteria bacterium]